MWARRALPKAPPPPSGTRPTTLPPPPPRRLGPSRLDACHQLSVVAVDDKADNRLVGRSPHVNQKVSQREGFLLQQFFIDVTLDNGGLIAQKFPTPFFVLPHALALGK